MTNCPGSNARSPGTTPRSGLDHPHVAGPSRGAQPHILKAWREVLEQGAQLLLQKETLVEEDLKALKGALPAVV